MGFRLVKLIGGRVYVISGIQLMFLICTTSAFDVILFFYQLYMPLYHLLQNHYLREHKVRLKAFKASSWCPYY